MTTPSYLAATTGIAAAAGQANQFLGTHAITYLYAGALQSDQSADGGAAIGISGGPPAGGFTHLAQQVLTLSSLPIGRPSFAYYAIYGKAIGNGCDLTASLYTNSSSTPGTQVGTVVATIPADFWSTSTVLPVWFPMPTASGALATSTTYQLVLAKGDVNGNNVGDASNYIALEKSNQSSGAATFASGTWTAQSYGFMFQVFDGTVSGPLTMIWEDSGARWTYLGWSSGVLASVNEYTVAQYSGGTVGQMRSVRTVTATNDLPTAVS